MPHAAIHHTVTPASLSGHRFAVTLRVARPAAQQSVSLPAWIPGSYLIREFARHLLPLHAEQNGQPLPLQQTGKSSWQVNCDPTLPLLLRYEVYAFDPSVRTAWLSPERGFFNATSLLLRVHGQEDEPHTLDLHPPAEATAAPWQAATALPAVQVNAQGFGLYRAAQYDELADHPFELGHFWQGQFSTRGITHRFVVAGAPPSFDGARLLRDTQAICEAALALWHPDPQRTDDPPPHAGGYLFMLNAVADGYGGLEHRASTALICARRDLPRLDSPASAAEVGEGYLTLLGLISHEYFHTWNVKRLRPAEFARYDYARENHTRLLWFFEGFTSYYDDLLLHRAGLIDRATYLKLLDKTLLQVQQSPGRRVQSVAQSSYDAWLRYYRPDENTPNSTVSYYAKGALLALCLDLSLRQRGSGTLDDTMRALWARTQGGPMTEADLRAVLHQQSGHDYAPELTAWAHGTDELPLPALLAAHGLRLQDKTPTPAQLLGLRVSESGGAIHIKTVLDGSAAAQAGLAAGDEWWGLEVPTAPAGSSAWRLRQLADLPLYAPPGTPVTALIARDERLLRLPLRLPQQAAEHLKPQHLAPADATAPGHTGWPGP